MTHQRWPRINAGAHVTMSGVYLKQILAGKEHQLCCFVHTGVL
jgi:hypothetical protein